MYCTLLSGSCSSSLASALAWWSQWPEFESSLRMVVLKKWQRLAGQPSLSWVPVNIQGRKGSQHIDFITQWVPTAVYKYGASGMNPMSQSVDTGHLLDFRLQMNDKMFQMSGFHVKLTCKCMTIWCIVFINTCRRMIDYDTIFVLSWSIHSGDN